MASYDVSSTLHESLPPGAAGAGRQGLTLVHFSDQPETFLLTGTLETAQRVPQMVLTLSREVEKCQTLRDGSRAASAASLSAADLQEGRVGPT
jgi:hypothetical protein